MEQDGITPGLTTLHTMTSTSALLPPFTHPIFTNTQLDKVKQVFLRFGVQSESFPPTLDPNTVTTASLFDPPSAFSLTLNLAGVQLALQGLGIVKADSEVKDMMFQLNQSAGVTQQNKQIEKKAQQQQQQADGGSAGTVPLSSRNAAAAANNGQDASAASPMSLKSPEKATVVVPPASAAAAAGGGVTSSARALSLAGSVAPSSNGQSQGSNSNNSAKFRISFPIFLELLTMTHPPASSSSAGGNNNKGRGSEAAVVRLGGGGGGGAGSSSMLSSPLPTVEEELTAVFRVLDDDGDGVISLADFKSIVQVLGRTLAESNSDVQTAMGWNDAQIAALLREADLDCNGQVTLEDFRRALLSA